MKRNGVLLTVFVDDYDAAIEFYVEKLGLFEVVADTQTSESSRYVCVAMKNHVENFMLHLKKPEVGNSSLIGNQAGDEVFVTLPVDDADSLHEQFKESGLSIEPELAELPYGCGFFIDDPFGNRLSVFQRYVSRFA